MFKKYPYGKAVRVRGDEKSGYRIQYTYDKYRFLPFLTMWFNYEPYINGQRQRVVTFEDLEEAKKYALKQYTDLIESQIAENERKRKQKRAKKIVWRHP